jgi:hypothetical protein
MYVFTKPKATPLKWKEQVRSEERTKRVGKVKEFGVLEHELRTEVYLDFFTQLPRRGGPMIDNVLCITTGRKCLIAAVVSGIHSGFRYWLLYVESPAFGTWKSNGNALHCR